VVGHAGTPLLAYFDGLSDAKYACLLALTDTRYAGLHTERQVFVEYFGVQATQLGLWSDPSEINPELFTAP
jgi:hypothetical protein